MGQVLKFKYGGASRSQQNQELEENIKAIQNALGTNPERADELNALAESFANYQKANNLSNRDARHFQLEASRVMRSVAEGNPLPAGANPIQVGKTVFDSDNETKGRVDEVIRAHRKANESAYNKPTQAATTTQSNGFQQLHTYNGDLGLNDVTNYLDTDLTARIGQFSKILGDNITNALNANSKGYRVSTPNGISIENLQSALSELQALNAGLGTNKATAKEYNALVDIARKAGVNGAVFANFFKDFLPKETTASKNKKSLLQEGFADYDFGTSGQHQSLIDWAKKNKYNFLTKDGETYIFDKDFNRINPISYVNMDYRNAGYNQGLFSDSEGKIWAGDVNNLTSEDWAYSPYSTVKQNAFDKRNKLFWTDNTYNPDTHEFAEGSDVLGELAKHFENKPFNYTDVSQLFNGNRKIVALSPTNKFDQDIYGNIKFDNNTKFAYLDDDGNLQIKSLTDLEKDYNLEGFGEEEQQVKANDVTHNWRFSTTDINPENMDYTGRTGWQKFGRGYLPWKGWLGNWFGIPDEIADDPQEFVNSAIKALQNLDGSDFDTMGVNDTNREVLGRFDYFNNPLNFLGLLASLMKNYDIKISPENQKFLGKLYMLKKEQINEQNRLASEKEGGVLKAAKGEKLDSFGNPIPEPTLEEKRAKTEKAYKVAERDNKLIEDTKAAGYGKDVNRYAANQEELGKNWSASDTLRVFTIAQDVGSIVASFAPGVGTAVAGGLGVTGLVTDTIADMMDPSVSSGQVAKNVAVNAGLAAVGMIPGAKVGKVMAKVIKFAPKIMFAASAMGIAFDESTQKTFDKLNSPDAQFTREDWKNVAHVMSLIAAGVRGGKQISNDLKARKIGKIPQGEIKNQTIGLKNADGKDIEIPKETVNAINEAIKSKNTKAVNSYIEQLKAQGATEESVNSVFKTEGKGVVGTVVDAAKKAVGKGKSESTTETPKYKEIKGQDVKSKNIDQIIAKLNSEQEILDRQAQSGWGRAGIEFANILGGGATTGMQRAILRQNPNLGLVISGNRYYANWNPYTDISGKRQYEVGQKWESLNGQSNPVASITPYKTKTESTKSTPKPKSAPPRMTTEQRTASIAEKQKVLDEWNKFIKQKPEIESQLDGVMKGRINALSYKTPMNPGTLQKIRDFIKVNSKK